MANNVLQLQHYTRTCNQNLAANCFSIVWILLAKKTKQPVLPPSYLMQHKEKLKTIRKNQTSHLSFHLFHQSICSLEPNSTATLHLCTTSKSHKLQHQKAHHIHCACSNHKVLGLISLCQCVLFYKAHCTPLSVTGHFTGV